MNDLAHIVGSDLRLVDGGLGLVQGTVQTREGLLRRLVTIAGDYIWQTNYGAGLPTMVGQSISVAAMQDTIKAQVQQDEGVDASQPVTVVVAVSGAGVCTCTVSYVDATSKQRTELNFSS